MARRVTQSAVNWAKFAELVPKDQTSHFAALRNKSDNYVRIVHELPEGLPAIDFSMYKSKLGNPKLAEEFEQKYKAVKIPYPEDKHTPTIQAQGEEAKKSIAEWIRDSNMRIKALEEEKARLASMVPLEHMTMEDFQEQFPHLAWNPDKPTFWPHDQESQRLIQEGLELAASGKEDEDH
ncbi:ATP synthase subunit d, mitochondrial [Galendromus occidentalis]|uniref:ATP synthase subunit d, mitochondrial n=1 Tax=Galendromus occidentalis TaxID=34638 RepID=A0AAJ6VUU5_9ACAR|nr:ATP synthase subunit d, mitochondrial [Galendromus occidentalis]